jgi:hypothetical protein
MSTDQRGDNESKNMSKQTVVIKDDSNIRVAQKITNGNNCDEKQATVIVNGRKTSKREVYIEVK